MSRAQAVAALFSLLVTTACSDSPVGTDLSRLARTADLVAAEKTAFEGTLYGCTGGTPGEIRVTPGGVLHFEGSPNTNMWVTNNPLTTGIEQNLVGAAINLNQGIGRAHATATITPEGIDGTWEVHFIVKIGGPFAGEAYGTGRGTGELEGLRIDFEVKPLSDPVTNICNPDLAFVAALSGTIKSVGN
jgi:hypothetical protein